MGKKGTVTGISVEDAIDYQMAVEHMYGIRIVMKLQTAVAGTKGAWRLDAIAYRPDEDGELHSASTRMVTYPTAHHKTFGGACMGALMALEDSLAASYWLQQMGVEDTH